MDNQHRQISGYRELAEHEIDAMNRVKALGPLIQEVVDELRAVEAYDQRWIATGVTDLQKGLMALTRGITRPTFF